MDILSSNAFANEPGEILADIAVGSRRADDGMARCEELLRSVALRPTRQRLMLGHLLFSNGHRHVTAEALFDEAIAANMQLSLATVYNTLNQLTEAGLLRRVAADGIKSFFDTDTSVHPHFYLEGEDILVDIPQGLMFEKMPDALPGHDIARVDVIVHIRRKTAP
ncbi:Fur family transcriptional regulator Irr [Bradyrhizobium sp.]|uniref:Fur family transcriptional regulator Irr n=1 Tax=Bradyrhizobium sp. TaxID=376 RepID=UPI0023863A83|nr:Fur family transcriptional regulator [Bradyrhizobium sp.]MDE2375867.1 transcriptional repressor [Bradyrhizobium sp.]